MRYIGVIALLVGCEVDSSDVRSSSALEGVYEVTRYAVDDGGCGAEVEAGWEAPFFEVTVDSFFGEEALVVIPCADETDCDGDLTGFLFDAWDDASGSGQAVVTSISGGECYFAWTDHTIEATDDGVRLRSETVEATEVVTATSLEGCQALQEEYAGPTACVRSETLEGT